MTTNSELLDQAMSRLGQRSSTRVRADVLVEINTTIDRLERGIFLPWFLEDILLVVFGIGTTSISLTSSLFAREQEDTRPYYTEDDVVYFLTKRLYGHLVGDDNATSVKYYAINENKLHIRMAPTEITTIKLPSYIRQTGNLVDNTSAVSNTWLINAKDWVVNEALAKVATFHLHNRKFAADLKGDAQAAKNELYIYHESRVHTNQDYFVGGSSGGS